MKKLLIILCLFAACILQAAELPWNKTLEYKYFFKPLDRLLDKNPEAAFSLLTNSHLLTEDFDYTSLFGNAQVVLLGEIHNQDVISREINVILKQLAANGFSYLATEFLLQTAQQNFDKIENKNIDLVELSKKTDPRFEPDFTTILTLKIADDLKLKVVGLEIDKILDRGGIDWAKTEEGLKTRNQAWFKKIQEILAQNPQARIVVHCGSLHSQYIANSLSTLLKQSGIKTHVVLFEVGPHPTLEKHINCQSLQEPGAAPIFAWYQFLCQFNNERKTLIIQVPSRFIEALGANTVIYFGDPNPEGKISGIEKKKLYEEMRFFFKTGCHLHPDSVSCQKLRNLSFMP